MKKTTLFLVLCGFLALTSQVFAQDPKADALLKASKAKFTALKDLSGGITYTLTNPNLDKPEVKVGTVDLSGNKFRVIFPSEELYCDGTYMWVYLKSKTAGKKSEVQKTDYDPNEGISLNKIYSIYEQKTKSRYDGVEGTSEKVSLFSLDEYSDFRLVEIWINKTTKLIDKAKVYGRNGTNHEYKISNVKTNVGLSPTIFKFDEAAAKGRGDYINDLTE